MRRKFLFRVGKILQRIGKALAEPGEKLQDFGLSLWDQNCDCCKCVEHKRAKEN